MQINTHTGNRFVSISVYFLLFFLVFDYIFAFTVFKSQMMIYFMMTFNLLSFIYCAVKYGCKSNQCANLWLLYLCLHIFSLGVNGNTSTIPYWIVSLLILYMPDKIVGVFKPRVFIYIGLFFAGGVFFQYLASSLYLSFIYPLFIDTASEFIESTITNEFGLSGFSPQTGTTAYLLLICQSVLLAFKNGEGFFNKKRIRILILFLFVLAVFLTGKRLPSLVSLLLLLASIYSSGSGGKTARNTFLLFLISIGCYIAFLLFIENVELFSDNVFLRRFANSYVSSSAGDDITSGRRELYQKAWELFYQEPILGIGANNYSKISGMETFVHNTYLQVLCEEGILRFPLFFVPLLFTFYNTIKEVSRRRIIAHRSFLLLSFYIQIVFVLYSFTGNTFVNVNNFVLYFLAVSFFTYSKNRVLANP